MTTGQTVRHAVRLIVLVAVMVGAAAFLDDPVPDAGAPRPKSIRFVEHDGYKEECGSCHLAFLPGLLPARSWRRLMGGLNDHFGANASLEDAVVNDLSGFLVANAADSTKATVRSQKLARLVPADDAPLRITETKFWERKHVSVEESVWKREQVFSKANCEACHRDADKGFYSEYDVVVPKDGPAPEKSAR